MSSTEFQKVNVDFPDWMLEALDQEAERLGIPRQAVIKTLLDAALRELAQRKGKKAS